MNFLLLFILYFTQSLLTTAAWISTIQNSCHNHRGVRISSSSLNAQGGGENDENDDRARKLMEQAERLRKEVEQFEQAKRAVKQQEEQAQEQERAARQVTKERYSAVVPILKPDLSTVQERCDFAPYWKDGSSFITVCEAMLPLGMLLGESEEFPGATVVDEVAFGSNGEQVGIVAGDIVRACTACKMEMDRPAWQLIAGGIGMPKTARFMYSVDNRPFEEVMNAIASNRMDPAQRPVLLVLERRMRNDE